MMIPLRIGTVATRRKSNAIPWQSFLFSECATVAERFLTVAKVGDVPEGEGRMVEAEDRLIALFLHEGVYYAIDDSCPHQGAPLSDGMVDDKSVTCSWHGWRFSLVDGRHLDGSRCRVATYPVRIVGETIEVGLP
jgi:nitrite reductase (NADH) small subunit/3-phenylpropionate/trans-cinnamate dioxygenase ferredoxin subunit